MSYSVFATCIAFHVVSGARPGRDFTEFHRHSLDLLNDDIQQPSPTEAASYPNYVLLRDQREPSECPKLTKALERLGISGEGNPCIWEGLECSSDCQLSSLVRDGNVRGDIVALRSFRHLVTLKLPNAKVGGSLLALGVLKKLTYLDLSGTEVSGNIAKLRNLAELMEVNLRNTKVTGSFLSLALLPRLLSLDLSNTQTGGNLHNVAQQQEEARQFNFNVDNQNIKSVFFSLRYLDLSGTEIAGNIHHLTWIFLSTLKLNNTKVEGSMVSLTSFRNLQIADLSSTNVRDDLNKIKYCPLLQILRLKYSKVTGSIKSLTTCRGLRSLDLANTNVVGDLQDLQHLPDLYMLQLGNSGVKGNLSVLEEPSAFTALQKLYLDNTLVQGNLYSLQKRRTLRGLSLVNTDVDGDVSSLWCMTGLQRLRLSNTKVVGNLDFSKNMAQLQVLRLHGTEVAGNLSSLHQLQSLLELGLSDTKVTGELKDLKDLTKLEMAHLDRLNTDGDVEVLENLTHLKALTLPKSKVFGDITVLRNFPRLEWLNLRYTQVFGDVMAMQHLRQLHTVQLTATKVKGDLMAFQNLAELRILDLQSVRVDGDLQALRSIRHLQLLRMTDKDVTGDISALYNMKGLQVLHLSNTKVHGDVNEIVGLQALRTALLDNTGISGWMEPSKWQGCCHHLNELNLADTQSGPLQRLHGMPVFSTQKPLLPALRSLNVSGCNLNGSIEDLLLPLAGSGISEIMASDCALEGEVPNIAAMRARVNGVEHVAWHGTLSRALQILDLSSNSLTWVPAVIASLRMDLRKNKVSLKMPPAMIRQAVDQQTDLWLQNTTLANPEDQSLLSDELRLGELYTKESGGFSCRELANPVLRVTPKLFLPRHMCECLPGYKGFAPSCSPCLENTYSSEMNSQVCHPCPRNSTALEGSASCKCDFGTITNKDGTLKCECRIGEAFVDAQPGQERCESCPKLKLDCPNTGSNASIAAVLDGHARLGEPLYKVYQCLDTARCLSGGCAEGYSGRLCSDCAPQHRENFGRCKPCAELESISVGRVLLGLCGGGMLALLGAAAWAARRKLLATTNLRLRCAAQLLAPLLAALLQLVQLWSVLGRLARPLEDEIDLSATNTTNATNTEKSQSDLWASYLDVLQLTATDLQGMVAFQCFFDAQTVRSVFAVVTPLVPLALLLACGLVEFVSRGTGIQVGLQLLTILFIGGASGAVRLLDCRRLDGTGKVSLGDYAFRRLMPHMLCTEAPWVDHIGRACGFCYGVLIPSFLAFLFAKQHLVMRQSKTFVAYHEGSRKVTLRLQMISDKESVKDDWKEKRLVAAAAVYVSVHVKGRARVTLLNDENAVTVEQLQTADQMSEVLESDLSVDLLLQKGEEAAILRGQGETIRHKTLVQMLTEHSILGEMEPKDSDRIMLGAKQIFSKYASCQFVWMEICLKLASAALVSVVGSKDGIWLSIAITLGMALMVGLAQPFARPQQNALYAICFACLTLAAAGFHTHQPWLSSAALLLPVLPLIISLARPDSQEALAMRLHEDLEKKLHDGPVEVSAERVHFF